MNSETLAIILGLVSAVCWGTADFVGGYASRKSGAYGVVFGSTLVSLIFVVGVALAQGETIPPVMDLVLGAIAGVVGAVGLTAFYIGLARGQMGLVAPITGVVTALVPVVVGVAIAGLPGAWQLAGFGLAMLAVWVLSYGGSGNLALADVGIAMLGGLGFGFLLVFINLASKEAVFWPLAASRLSSVVVTVPFAMWRGENWHPAGQTWKLWMFVGIVGVLGNAAFAFAGQFGRLDVAAVVGSLYPAGTIFLARTFLKEQLSPRQWVGAGLALLAVVLIAL